MRALLLLAVVACGSSKPAKPDIDATRAVETLRSYAERCLACTNDKDCVKALRDEYDPYKRRLFKSRESYAPAEQQAFDLHFGQLAQCGDAAGVTIWKN
jgi:hypothetical protein